MTIELTMLVYSIIAFIGLVAVQAVVGIIEYGPVNLAGARDNLASPKSELLGRLKRAVQNAIESYIIFVPLAIIAHLVGLSNDMTVLAAQLFLVSRIAHSVLYALGVPWVRTIAFAGSLASIIILIIELLTFA